MDTFVKILLFVTMICLGTATDPFKCPSECSCTITSSVGAVDCSSQNLDSTLPVFVGTRSEPVSKVSKVDFSNNKLTTLDFKVLFSLIAGMEVEELDFSYNSISVVTGTIDIEFGTDFQIINLSHNALTSFPSNVVPLHHIYVHYSLDISYNQLTELPSNMFGTCKDKVIPNFHFLASNNLISRIDDDAFQGIDLVDTVLDLRSNQLTTLSPGFKTPRGVDKFLFSENPWNCDCDLRWIINPKRFIINYTASDPPNCFSPPPLQGHPLFNLKAKDFTCPPFQHGSLIQNVPANTEEFTLTCPVSADPPEMEIKWNVFLPSGDPNKPLKLSFTSETLTLNEGMMNPDASFQCIATNNAGSLELDLDVRING